jgi:hypothetical protein
MSIPICLTFQNPCRIKSGFPEPSIFEYNIFFTLRARDLRLRGRQPVAVRYFKKSSSKRSSLIILFYFLQIHVYNVF